MRNRGFFAVLIVITIFTLGVLALLGVMVLYFTLTKPWPQPGSGANIGLAALWLATLLNLPTAVMWFLYFLIEPPDSAECQGNRI